MEAKPEQHLMVVDVQGSNLASNVKKMTRHLFDTKKVKTLENRRCQQPVTTSNRKNERKIN